MKSSPFALILLVMILLSVVGYGQGTILFLNGKEKRYKTAEVRDEYVVYQPENKEGSWKRRADRYNVFALVRDNGTELVLYSPDTVYGQDPSVEEMRDFIRGEQMADAEFKKPLNLIGGLGAGLAGSVAGFYGIPVPVMYAAIAGRFTPEFPKHLAAGNHSDAFIEGYRKKSRNIKINKTLLGGGVGFAVGLSALIIVFAD